MKNKSLNHSYSSNIRTLYWFFRGNYYCITYIKTTKKVPLLLGMFWHRRRLTLEDQTSLQETNPNTVVRLPQMNSGKVYGMRRTRMGCAVHGTIAKFATKWNKLCLSVCLCVCLCLWLCLLRIILSHIDWH